MISDASKSLFATLLSFLIVIGVLKEEELNPVLGGVVTVGGVLFRIVIFSSTTCGLNGFILVFLKAKIIVVCLKACLRMD